MKDLPPKKTRLRTLPIDPDYEKIQWTPAQNHRAPKSLGYSAEEGPNSSETGKNQPEKRPGIDKSKQLGPLTINADQMLDSDIEQIISDTQQSGQALHIRDNNRKVTYKTFEKRIESDLELASDLSSSTEIGKGMENIKETILRLSKRLTKTNPIVRLNIHFNQSDYRKHRKTAESVTTTGDNRKNDGAGQRRKPVNRSHYKTNHSTEARHADHGIPDTPIRRRGRHTDHNSNPFSLLVHVD